ncbi:MAG: hypothetical protein ACR2IA_01745 [Pyrinomonadaceae bacterium]
MIHRNLQKIKTADRNPAQSLLVFKEIGQTLPATSMSKFRKT